ncbi:MAG TPA: hypothetical protein VM073_10545 [Usitatibacter sp.]|nr:hypothetical protein [Usitatibacter sp.]
MKALRRLGFALWLALALVLGQHAAAMHDLGHASEKLSHPDSKPAKVKCGECFACAQLVGGGAPAHLSFEAPAAQACIAIRSQDELHSAPTFAYFSRGPPKLS